MKVTEVMELVGLVNKFEKYLKEDLDIGDDNHDMYIVESFKEVIQSKIKFIPAPQDTNIVTIDGRIIHDA